MSAAYIELLYRRVQKNIRGEVTSIIQPMFYYIDKARIVWTEKVCHDLKDDSVIQTWSWTFLLPQSWLGSQVKMIPLLVYISFLIGARETAPVNNGALASFTSVLGLTLLPIGFAAGPRYTWGESSWTISHLWFLFSIF